MIQMSKKMKWICGIGALVLVAALCSMCGGSDGKSSDSNEQHQNESREMAATTLKLKGTHASLFKVDEPYRLSLVKTPEDEWQVRLKINFAKAKSFDEKKYQPALESCHVSFIDDFDVELTTAEYNLKDFNTLLVKEIGESEDISFHTWSYRHLSHADAKKIYDAVCGVVISNIELEELKKEDAVKKTTKSILEDDDMKDLKDAAESAEKILEAEKKLLDALF